MCTVSWRGSEEADAWEVFFSRDEKRERVKAESPEVRFINGVRCLFPRDPAGGGTWVGVNEYGVVACLLNDYRVPFEYREGLSLRSRGLLVSDVLAEKVQEDGYGQHVRDLVLGAAFAPFRLLIIIRGKCHGWSWDGEILRAMSEEETQCPVTSSSWDSVRVEDARRSLYDELVLGKGASLQDFHTHQLVGDAESSVCMSRELTQTVSLTRLRVGSSRAASVWYGDRIGEGGGEGAFGMEFSGKLELIDLQE